MTGIGQLLGSGGTIPSLEPLTANQITPRRRGVRQGVALMLIGLILTPVLAVVFRGDNFLIPLAAIVGFWGGLLRILYAAIFEEGSLVNKPPVQPYRPAQQPTVPHFMKSGRMNNPGLSQSAASPFIPTRVTGELTQPAQPASVTEATTQLLDKTPEE
ncbi:MAG: hypothetical protein ACRD63_03630 [Pyrinomonadaceae bacterium]